MAQVLINDKTLQALADAVRQKTGSEERFYPSELIDMIDNISQTIQTTTYNVTSVGNLYTISASTWNNMDLSLYNDGDIFLITSG